MFSPVSFVSALALFSVLGDGNEGERGCGCVCGFGRDEWRETLKV